MNEDETSSEEEDLRKNEASSEKEGFSEKNQANDNEESSEIEDLERRHEYELPTKINNLLLGVRAMIRFIQRSSIIQTYIHI
ncbi:unnamed protein product [Didymodactylos carnosus]|uniref:Uncharacterized protein n=1 Tax=Didymodactylos carnosus TaxID=1234261 RepID=A0A8S2ESV3_9BILA|nr:unnamed protein product [Didymodactylos carnosus]CAF4103241.1 unnamed protein product [Didymodactylos carnosus]